MASFDFIDASSHGYERIWRDRKYLLRMAFPVIFVKVACLFAIFVLGAQDEHLRQGLISLPGFAMEALYIIALVRYILYQEPIALLGAPRHPDNTDEQTPIYERSASAIRAVKAATILYLLIRVLEAAFIGWQVEFTTLLHENPPEQKTGINPMIYTILLLGVLGAMIWGFRLLWLYIPMAMELKIGAFLEKIKGMRISVDMFATWVICSLPMMVVFSAIIQFLTMALTQGSAPYIIITSITQAVAEMIILSVQVAAMTYGIASVVSKQK